MLNPKLTADLIDLGISVGGDLISDGKIDEVNLHVNNLIGVGVSVASEFLYPWIKEQFGDTYTEKQEQIEATLKPVRETMNNAIAMLDLFGLDAGAQKDKVMDVVRSYRPFMTQALYDANLIERTA